jgi:hypothetical protein
VLIALIGGLHAKHPHLVTLPLYLIPCGMLTLKLGRDWGAVATATAAALGPVLEMLHNPSYGSVPLLFWNWLMRLFTLWVILFLFDRAYERFGEDEKIPG